MLQQLVQSFWQRWSKEYLHHLIKQRNIESNLLKTMSSLLQMRRKLSEAKKNQGAAFEPPAGWKIIIETQIEDTLYLGDHHIITWDQWIRMRMLPYLLQET